MGQYKVPQNVEAEDKIIGPLTLKQFIYAVIGIAWAGLCFLIFRSVPVVMIVVAAPFTILFMLLAFYQRDGQNFEQYLVALVGYFSQSRQRLWTKEAVIESFKVEPPKPVTEQTQRDPNEVRSQLEKLATIVDARGWAEHPESSSSIMPSDQRPMSSESDRIIRPVVASPNKTLSEPEAHDVLDLQSSPLAQNLTALIDQASYDVKTEAVAMMRQRAITPPPVAAPIVAALTPVAPVPTTISIAPGIAAPMPMPAPVVPIVPVVAPSVSVTPPVSSDIIKLATERDDLTISQLAAQATRTGALPEGQSVSLNNGVSSTSAPTVKPVQ